ncbi:MAG: hypothetical protein IJ347_06945 [Faecalibacterium sp.]|nr:hypothetical protein [Faecalibacterium sp.]
MTLRSILVLVLLIAVFSFLIWWIAQQGGWQGGCGGDCKNCGSKCDTPKPEDCSGNCAACESKCGAAKPEADGKQ